MNKPLAFVIMPFGEGFDEICGLFIAGAVSEAGYEVVRADDIRSQQNILKDVLAGLTDSALVVADLTGSNPNVYYELGLAHALGKRVVLLTQHVDELPFDLRSYRVIPYSTHFAEIAKARTQLHTVARDALDDKIAFGSPVTDFLSATPSRKQSVAATLGDSASATHLGEAGVLDHLVDLEEGFAGLGAILQSNTAEMNAISEATTAVAERLTTLKQSNSPARTRRVVVIAFANQLSDYAKSLASHNDEYAGCFRRHVAPGGVVLVEPWFPPGALDTSRVFRVTGTHQGMHVTRLSRNEVEDRVSRLYFEYELDGPDGKRHATEVHELGLFTTDEMRSAFEASGSRARFDAVGLTGRGLWVATAAA